MNGFIIKLYFSLLIMGLSSPIFANIITYTDKDLFLTQTESTSATGAIENRGNMGPGPRGIGDLTFSTHFENIQYSLWTGDYTHYHPGNEIAIGGPDHLNISSSQNLHAIGFYFIEPADEDSIFSLSLLSQGQSIASFEFNAPDDVLSFIGVYSSDSFDGVAIREISGGAENEYFGEFFTSQTQTQMIPEAPILALFGLGLIALGTKRKFVS